MSKENPFIAVIDYGAGNIRNVMKAIAYVNMPAKLTKDPDEILAADGIVIPGVGAYRAAMDKIKAHDLVIPLQKAAANGTPMLGVCLGMQLLFDSSTEFGETSGLGLIPGEVVTLPQKQGFKVPQMGWNQNNVAIENSLTQGIKDEFTYFVHSYYVKTDAQYIAASVDYGVQVPSIVIKDNIIGAQFHPEKSGEVGLRVWQAFADMVSDKAVIV
ncbi:MULTISPECIES: imidazole glycerol phosphate synthase subunit HisH [Leuconostoc]|uniref:Imidazole glycerol phosphate synthase subunit HisH n=1 Tax=Leuconostoc kimchii TaxID=136609 RepID=A0ABX5SNF0_9LACO|nr:MULTISPECIES: imidazole glycerol phosphate synthase subunit HisH [Leuconostoc]AEJ30849.1 imidazole glycerol phosphate synthase subunit HisH [Leuconostoc sp. C2]QBR47954.1 imidazole glycerol phosphate synthase subunit HisH [Leuconostoc kimchii]